MDLIIDGQNRVFINKRCVGKMDFPLFTKVELEENEIQCFIQLMKCWVIKKYLRESTIEYLSKQIGNRRTPELSSFWINGNKIFDNVNLIDRFTPIVQLLLIALDFVTEFESQPDRMWLILTHIHQGDVGVERKINILNPKLKVFVLNRKQGRGLSSTDFHTVILPCFNAIIRDLMGVGKR